MLRDINLSQLLAMISVSMSAKQVKITGGDLGWRDLSSVDVTQNCHNLTLGWKGLGRTYCLCMTLDEMRSRAAWTPEEKYKMPILRAFYFSGDNCNHRTKFIYEIMGNEIDIIDDIGIVGNGGSYAKKNLLKFDPNEIYGMKVWNEEQWAIYGEPAALMENSNV